MTVPQNAGDWAGRHLGERTVSYTERDAILYAIAVGAPASDLDLVFEDRLRVLPTFGLTLAQWAPDVLADEGAFDNRAVHGAQSLDVARDLPRSGELLLSARVGDVWDKTTAAIFTVIVECDYFTATWSLFAPGFGGFGGERGPSASSVSPGHPDRIGHVATSENQAVLYRLLSDRHHIHVDPEAARRIGQDRPILHGLCTLAASTLALARIEDAHPADLRHLEGRFSGVVFPGDELEVRAHEGGAFEVRDGDRVVIDRGQAAFA